MKKFMVIMMALALCFAVTDAFAQPYTDYMDDDPYDSTPDEIITPASADDGNPNIYSAINLLLGTGYTSNEETDDLQFTDPNSYWRDLSDDENAGTFVAISIAATYNNTLGVYEVPSTGTGDIPLIGPFSGYGFLGLDLETDPFPAETLDIATDDFGFYLENEYYRWDSDPSKNGGLDHMLVYDLSGLAGSSVIIKTGCTQGTPLDIESIECTGDTEEYVFQSPYLITWEDMAYNGLTLGDEDYDDMIYLVDRVQPIVPEPATMVLLGSGLLGMAGFRRRRK